MPAQWLMECQINCCNPLSFLGLCNQQCMHNAYWHCAQSYFVCNPYHFSACAISSACALTLYTINPCAISNVCRLTLFAIILCASSTAFAIPLCVHTNQQCMHIVCNQIVCNCICTQLSSRSFIEATCIALKSVMVQSDSFSFFLTLQNSRVCIALDL